MDRTQRDRDALAMLVAPLHPSELLKQIDIQPIVFLSPSADPRLELDGNELNHTLEMLRVPPQRVSLVKNGNALPLQEFIRPVVDGASISKLDISRLTRQLQRGATLIVHSVEDLVQSIDLPLRALRRHLACPWAFANLYATWGLDRGFDVHRDPHDTCILQIAGSKEWFLLKPEADPAALKGYGDTGLLSSPLFDQSVTLEPGSLLYIRKSVPHVALPRSPKSVHITFGLWRPTLGNFIRWCTEQHQWADLFDTLIPDHHAAQRLQQLFAPDTTDSLVRAFLEHLQSTVITQSPLHLFDSSSR
jgi:hypothetical protein